jgi:Flp pilus assembly protein TadD
VKVRRATSPTPPTAADLLSRLPVVCLLLAALVVVVYLSATHCGFVNYDDPDYFSANRHVQAGLTASGAVWAFTTGELGNWHPLTWLSLMLDAEWAGNNPSGPHLTNIFFHAANTLLLFLMLHRLTRAVWRSAMVAALFALHPLHVESVAWISERKDVLSAFFGLLALLAYVGFTEETKVHPPSSGSGATRRSKANVCYALTFVLFAASLMSKPMLVTLPFVMLLLDWWPFRRISNLELRNSNLARLLVEKIPFFALALVACVVTFVVQQKGGAVADMTSYPLSVRLENALVSYARYLGKTFWPEPLAVPYPHPGAWPMGLVIFSAGLFVALCAIAIVLARKLPYLSTGWFWFVGMLVPVIGIVQVGDAAMADRYTYLPLVGVFIALVWGAAELSGKLPVPKPALIFTVALILIFLGWRTRVQLQFWKDSGTLFRHTLAVTKNNYTAENDLGTWLAANGQTDEAMACFRRVLGLRPDNVTALYNLGNALARQKRWDEAVENYRHALKIDPSRADVLVNLGVTLTAKNKDETAEARACYEAALKLDPDSVSAHNNLGVLLFRQGDFSGAAEQFLAASRLEPEQPQHYANLGDALARMGKTSAAAECYRQALQLDPENEKFQRKLQSVGGQ